MCIYLGESKEEEEEEVLQAEENVLKLHMALNWRLIHFF